MVQDININGKLDKGEDSMAMAQDLKPTVSTDKVNETKRLRPNQGLSLNLDNLNSAKKSASRNQSGTGKSI